MQNNNLKKQLHLALAQLATQGVGKDDYQYQELRRRLDQLEKLSVNNLSREDKELKISKVNQSEIITKDEDIYYFKHGIMIPEAIVERIITESQAKSTYFVLASLCKFANSQGVVTNQKVEDLAQWCGYQDSSTYRLGLQWLAEHDFIMIDRSSRINTYLIFDYKFGRAVIVPEEDIKAEAKKTTTKELRLKWTYYLRNQHSPVNKQGKFNLSLSYLKKMTKSVSFTEVLSLAKRLKEGFFTKCEIVKSGINRAKDKLKVEFNNFRLGIVDNLAQEVERINHSQYFTKVAEIFKNLDIKLTLPNFRRAYTIIEEIGEYCLDQVLLKSKRREYISKKQSVGYFIHLMRLEEHYKS
jgi:hypothetical protein